jgi:RNA polymerase sigma-70 factor (ECF subfamily)
MGVREADLDDALQETFVVAHKKLHTLRPDASPRSWLYSIAINVARSMRRKARERPSEDVEPGSAPQSAPERLLLEKLLVAITEEQREVVVLHYIEGLTFREIGDALSLPLQTVYSRLRVAVSTMERLVEER